MIEIIKLYYYYSYISTLPFDVFSPSWPWARRSRRRARARRGAAAERVREALPPPARARARATGDAHVSVDFLKDPLNSTRSMLSCTR